MLQGAEAVYIVPKLVKGGFIFGAEGGDGVLLHRTGQGWSTPRFYGMGSASFRSAGGCSRPNWFSSSTSKRALRGIEKVRSSWAPAPASPSSPCPAARKAPPPPMAAISWSGTSGTGAYAGLTFQRHGHQAGQGDERGPGHRQGGHGPAQELGQHL
jgi:hypothetical protein